MRQPPILSLIPLLVMTLAGCTGGEPTEEAPAAEGPPPVKVEAVTVSRQPFTEQTWLPAEVDARESARVSAEAMGRITWICCEENARVKKGQVLARIDTALNQAQVAQARATLELADKQYQRVQALEGTGAATAERIDQARSQRDGARAALEQALAAKRKTTLTSPLTGRIATRHVVTGEVANPGQALFDLVDIDQVEVVAGLPERDFSFLKMGQRTEVRLDAYPDERFEGEVTRVGLVAGPARTFPVEITVDNPEGRLRPGMVGEVRLDKRSFEEAVVVPMDAVVDEYQSRRVYVVGKDGLAHEREVVLGPRGDGGVVVLEGLSPGETLVVTGHRFLTDERAVEVVRQGRLGAGGRPVFEAAEETDGQAAPAAVEG